MCRRAHIGLNKGEPHHALKNALRIGRQGEIRDRSSEGQHYRMAGLNPLAAIVIYWNTVRLGEAVRQRKRAGLPVEPELLAHISGEYQEVCGTCLEAGVSPFIRVARIARFGRLFMPDSTETSPVGTRPMGMRRLIATRFLVLSCSGRSPKRSAAPGPMGHPAGQALIAERAPRRCGAASPPGTCSDPHQRTATKGGRASASTHANPARRCAAALKRLIASMNRDCATRTHRSNRLLRCPRAFEYRLGPVKEDFSPPAQIGKKTFSARRDPLSTLCIAPSTTCRQLSVNHDLNQSMEKRHR